MASAFSPLDKTPSSDLCAEALTPSLPPAEIPGYAALPCPALQALNSYPVEPPIEASDSDILVDSLQQLPTELMTIVAEYMEAGTLVTFASTCTEYRDVAAPQMKLHYIIHVMRIHYGPSNRGSMQRTGLVLWTRDFVLVDKAKASELWKHTAPHVKARLNWFISQYTTEHHQVITLTVDSIFSMLWAH